jgi:hypothetical protein
MLYCNAKYVSTSRKLRDLTPPQFFLDSLEDELTLMTLTLLVKDLLILFQAGNEGVINVLGMKRFGSIIAYSHPVLRALL